MSQKNKNSKKLLLAEAEDELNAIMNGDKKNLPELQSYLYNYFNNSTEPNQEFEKKLLSCFPSEFVKAVQVSQVFLKKNRLESLEKYDYSDLSTHKKVWRILHEIESNLWKEINIDFELISNLEITDVLVYLVLWIENYRFGKNKNVFLPDIYNFFIKFYLHKTDKQINFTKEKFDDTFVKLLQTPNNKNPLSKILNSIGSWVVFEKQHIHIYCYDSNVNLVEDDYEIYMKEPPESRYKYNLGAVRYEKNYLNYTRQSEQLIPKAIESGVPIVSINPQGLIKTSCTYLLLKDLCIDDLEWEGEKNGLLKLFLTIGGYAHYRLDRYELVLNNSKTKENWFLAYYSGYKNAMQKGTEIYPYLLHKTADINSFLNKIMPKYSEKFKKGFLKQFSYEVNKKKQFDRFKIDYEVNFKPFMKIGEHYFSPIAFFATNEWFNAAAQVSLKYLNFGQNNKANKENSEKMEKKLAKLFEKKGFEVKRFNYTEENRIKGDIDIIVEDQNVTLCIQLKRTLLRFNLKEMYSEHINSDKKASKQLNDGVSFLSKENGIFLIKNEPTKWIVSTSYESINSKIDGCNKINYFDLLYVLRETKLKSLKDIIKYLEQDKDLLNYFDKHNQIEKQLIGLPLPLEVPNDSIHLLKIKKKELILRNYLIKGRFLLKKNDSKAIKLLKCYLYYRPNNNADAYDALANAYANMKNIPKMKKYFEKALQLRPNDPYIKRNYSSALFENKFYLEGLLLLLELYQSYPLLGDIKRLFFLNYKKLKPFLAKEERTIIEDKMK